MKKILIEASTLEQDHFSGVNYFADGLSRALIDAGGNDLQTSFLWLNFLGKKSPKNDMTKSANRSGLLREIKIMPQRIYAKLVYYGVAPPLPVAQYDWVLFPNFYIWPTTRKLKKAVIIHDIGYLRFPQYVEEKNRKFLMKVASRSIKDADLIISNSQFTTDEIKSSYQVNDDRIITLDIPVDEKQFAPTTNRGFDHLKTYGIKKPYILSIGTIEPRKNIEGMIDAYCALPESIRKQYSFVLAGRWGWKIDETRAKIEKLQDEGYDIITPGYIDMGDKSTLFLNASYNLIATHYEGFGMPLLEALYCGIPTVASDIPVLREVGGDACLWSGTDSHDIAAKLESLINDDGLAGTLREKSLARAREFSWEKTGNRLYDRLFNTYGSQV